MKNQTIYFFILSISALAFSTLKAATKDEVLTSVNKINTELATILPKFEEQATSLETQAKAIKIAIAKKHEAHAGELESHKEAHATELAKQQKELDAYAMSIATQLKQVNEAYSSILDPAQKAVTTLESETSDSARPEVKEPVLAPVKPVTPVPSPMAPVKTTVSKQPATPVRTPVTPVQTKRQ